MNTEFDYTTMRLGKRVGQYNRKIILCPKCGRRGMDNGSTGPTRDGKGKMYSIIHTGQIDHIAGTPFFHIKEWCSYVIPISEVKAHV